MRWLADPARIAFLQGVDGPITHVGRRTVDQVHAAMPRDDGAGGCGIGRQRPARLHDDSDLSIERRAPMRSFICLCDMSTEQECLDRHLFGTNAGENHQLHYSKVAVGDRLFLYNFETGILRGPFTALTPCTYGLDPKAWKKTRRSFPWQVRVDSSSVSTVMLRADDFATFILLARTKIGLLPTPELGDEQVAQLLTRLHASSS
jgi:Development and cell death domain